MLPLLFLLAQATTPPPTISHVTIIDVDSGEEREVATLDGVWEAPNWSRDSQFLVINSGGKLWKVPMLTGKPEQIETGSVGRINNDHGFTVDGKWLAISAGQIFVLPAAGGTPRQLTSDTPSYFHAWAPDGKSLAFTGKRGDNFDLYSIAFDGGAEKRLTSHAAYDDGPDYSVDGKWIYFNSDRSGNFDIWRIPASGAGPNDSLAEQITKDEMEDWFPHPSPDGKRMVVLSFQKGTKGHPANQNDVVLRLLDPETRQLKDLKHLFGGQGTMNVNSWSPNSRRLAFVRYELK
jgi:TolB protein